MTKPLTINEVYEILGLIHDNVCARMLAIIDAHPWTDRGAPLTDDQRQFVADCVKSVIAEIDYVLSPVPDEDEIATAPVEKTA